MNHLKRGLHNTFSSIKKHKVLFTLIIILQLIFVVSSLALGAQYLLKILEDARGIIGPLENANYDSQKIEQGEPFTPDYASIYNSYQSMLKNVFWFCIGMAILFLLLNGSIWLLSHRMLQEQQQLKLRMRKSLQFLLKASVSALLWLGSFAVVSYYVLLYFIRTSQSFSNIASVLKVLLIILFVVYYFLMVALAVAPPASWKKFALTWKEVSITRVQKTVPTYFSIALILLTSFIALYGAIEYGKSVTLLLVLGLFCIIIVSVTRIFWIAAIQQIQQQQNETSYH